MLSRFLRARRRAAKPARLSSCDPSADPAWQARMLEEVARTLSLRVQDVHLCSTWQALGADSLERVFVLSDLWRAAGLEGELAADFLDQADRDTAMCEIFQHLGRCLARSALA